jgi:hypothetical protein
MKTLLLVSVLLLAMQLPAQKHKGTKHALKIPEEVKSSFIKENPDAEASWKKEDTNFRAQFIDRVNLAHVRVYDAKGNMVYRDDVMESYPEPIHAFLTKTYPGEGFTLWSRIDGLGTLTYYTYRNSETLWFDKDGQFVSPKKKARADSISAIILPTN